MLVGLSFFTIRQSQSGSIRVSQDQSGSVRVSQIPITFISQFVYVNLCYCIWMTVKMISGEK